MFETTFRNLDDTLRKDAGCSSELDYIEHARNGYNISDMSNMNLTNK